MGLDFIPPGGQPSQRWEVQGPAIPGASRGCKWLVVLYSTMYIYMFQGTAMGALYIYTLGAWGSPGTPAPRGFIYMWGWGGVGVGLGWGGVGMVTFLALAHMVGATQVMGWGGVGMITFFELAHMVGATQVMGWGGVGWG